MYSVNERAIESARARLKAMEFNLLSSSGDDNTIAKRKRQVETAKFTLDVLVGYSEEKAKCEYCGGVDGNWRPNTNISVHGDKIVTNVTVVTHIKFCPMCGKRLEDGKSGGQSDLP